MLVGCGYKDEFKYNVLVANLKFNITQSLLKACFEI